MKKFKLYGNCINKNIKLIESKRKILLILFVVSLLLCVCSFFIKSLITGAPRDNLIRIYNILGTSFDRMIEQENFKNKDVYKEELSKLLNTENFKNVSKIEVYLNQNPKNHNKKSMNLMYSYENRLKKNTWEAFISSKLRTYDGKEIYCHIVCEEPKYEAYKLPVNIICILSLVVASIFLILYLYMIVMFHKIGR